MPEIIYTAYNAIRNMVIWGILIIVGFGLLTFFLYLGVARNELESAKKWVVDVIDKSGGIDDGTKVAGRRDEITNNKFYTKEELEEEINNRYGGRRQGLITLSDITLNYTTVELDYFGCPTDLTLERGFYINIGGKQAAEPFIILRASNGGSNRGYMDVEENVRYELGEQYLSKTERSGL